MLDQIKFQQKGRILIIDYDVDLAHMLCDMLLAENYEVEVAYNRVKRIFF